MRILVFSQYYPPEVGATQTRVATFARHLVEAGHDVEVIAELPNHPKGVIFEGWTGKLVDRRIEDGISTTRLWVYTSPTKSFWRRIAFYLTYCAGATLAGGATAAQRRPDVVFASSPPLFVLIAAWVAALVGRAPLVVDIRDIWPAVGEALGELRPGRAFDLAQRLERFLYRRATHITAVTLPFVEHIIGSGIDQDRVSYLPNGTLPDLFTPDRLDPAVRSSIGAEPGDLVVGYVGNHGIAQGLDVILDAAAATAGDPRIRYLFVGEGPEKARLRARADAEGLANVTFLPEVALEAVTPYMTACDLLVVPLRALELLEQFVPSKLFDSMACGRPVALMVDGEARAILEEADAGWFVPPEDAAALVHLLGRIVEDREGLTRSGANGRRHVVQHYDRNSQAAQLEGLLRTVVGSAQGSPERPSR